MLGNRSPVSTIDGQKTSDNQLKAPESAQRMLSSPPQSPIANGPLNFSTDDEDIILTMDEEEEDEESEQVTTAVESISPEPCSSFKKEPSTIEHDQASACGTSCSTDSLAKVSEQLVYPVQKPKAPEVERVDLNHYIQQSTPLHISARINLESQKSVGQSLVQKNQSLQEHLEIARIELNLQAKAFFDCITASIQSIQKLVVNISPILKAHLDSHPMVKTWLLLSFAFSAIPVSVFVAFAFLGFVSSTTVAIACVSVFQIGLMFLGLLFLVPIELFLLTCAGALAFIFAQQQQLWPLLNKLKFSAIRTRAKEE
ncbi:hypothetical protein BDR26DRAFT_867145 [Obelidium mucronatum]|nr:hypothetical protein BDR26DRAFT_867145 [Obelidium mucronatum]